VKTLTMRPPYGGITERQRRWAHGEFGYKIILWDVDPLDWKVRNAAHVEREILQGTRAGSIVLSHDIHKSTVDAMPATLDALIARGFKFVTVSELIAMDRPVPPKAKATPKAKGTSPSSKVPNGAEPEQPVSPGEAVPPAPGPQPTPPGVEETKAPAVAPVPVPAQPSAAQRSSRAATSVR
jgi:hypothetical protein